MKSRILVLCAIIFQAASTIFAGAESYDSKSVAPSPAPSPWCETPKEWEFRIGLPGFLSALNGDYGARGIATDLNVGFDEILPRLNEIPIALSASVRYKRWEFFADGEWIQLGVTENLHGLLFTQASLDIGFAFWEGFVGYRLINCEKAALSLYAGARYNYYSADFKIQNSNDPRFPLFRDLLGIPQSGQKSGDTWWVDPVVGISGRYRVAKAVTLYASGDIGGFDATSGSAYEVVRTGAGLARASVSSSDWSYQVQGGLEVQWARHIWTQLGWRYLKYDYQISGYVNKTDLNGPFIQAGVNF